MRALLTFCFAMLMAFAGCDSRTPAPVRNVVLVCIDTVRFDTFFLAERIGLVDPLASRVKQALVYSKAHAAAPWTVPSVVSLFTGRYPAQHAAGRFDHPVANLNEQVPSRLPQGFTTLAERFRDSGDRTAAFVAHPWFQSGYGMERGFDELHMRKGAETLTELGMDWLDQSGGQDSFLYLHFMEPHDRHLDVGGFDEVLADADPDVLAAARRFAPSNICLDPDALMCRRFQVYVQTVMETRNSLSELLTKLEARGRLQDTIVLVYSDHGEEFHDHLEAAERRAVDPRGIHGFGHGQSLYQEQLHVPLLVWHPGLSGQHVGSVVSLVDVAPTLLSWAGIDHDASVFSGSVLPAAEKRRTRPFDWSRYRPGEWPRQSRRIFASGIAYGPEQMAVLEDGWKYIWHEASGDTRLYDLGNDPGEREPVDAPGVIADLEPALDQYFSWFTEQAVGAPELTDEQVEKLKGVGYLQGRATDVDRNDSEGAESGEDSDG